MNRSRTLKSIRSAIRSRYPHLADEVQSPLHPVEPMTLILELFDGEQCLSLHCDEGLLHVRDQQNKLVYAYSPSTSIENAYANFDETVTYKLICTKWLRAVSSPAAVEQRGLTLWSFSRNTTPWRS